MICRIGIFSGLLLVLLVVASPAYAATPELDLKGVRDRFEYGDYADAAKLAKSLIDEGRLVTEDQLVEAYRVLGLSLFYMDQKDDARSAFVSLLSIEPDYRLDPFFHPPRVVEFFDKVKAQNEALLAPIREQKKRIAEEKRRQEEARQRLLQEEARRREAHADADDSAKTQIVERRISNHEYLVNWVPFGAGQFQNGEPFKGSLIAAGEAVTGLASIVGFVVVANLQRCQSVPLPAGSIGEAEQTTTECGIPPESLNLAQNMDRVKWVAGGLFWSLVVYGIVDANVHYKPFVVLGERRIDAPKASDAQAGDAPTSEPKHSAPETLLMPRLRFAPWAGPDGAGATFTLQF